MAKLHSSARAVSVALAAGSIALACSAQVDPEYRGEPIAVVNGVVEVGDGPAPESAELALLWLDRTVRISKNAAGQPIDAEYAHTRTAVEGDFPANFTLEILEPEPPIVPGHGEGQRDGIGIFAALRPDFGPTIEYTDIVGISTDFFVLFLSGLPENAEAEAGLAIRHGIPNTRGYHLVKAGVTPEFESEWYRCQAQGVCEYPPQTGYYVDGDYERCQHYSPEVKVCEATGSDAYGPTFEPECQALVDSKMELFGVPTRGNREPVASVDCGGWFQGSSPAPQGFDTPITVTLGVTTADALFHPRIYQPSVFKPNPYEP